MEPQDDPDPMPPEPIFPPEPRLNLTETDLKVMVAMGFEQGYKTGRARLKFPPGTNEGQERTSMAYAYAALLLREKPWEQIDKEGAEAIANAVENLPKVIVP